MELFGRNIQNEGNRGIFSNMLGIRSTVRILGEESARTVKLRNWSKIWELSVAIGLALRGVEDYKRD